MFSDTEGKGGTSQLWWCQVNQDRPLIILRLGDGKRKTTCPETSPKICRKKIHASWLTSGKACLKEQAGPCFIVQHHSLCTY